MIRRKLFYWDWLVDLELVPCPEWGLGLINIADHYLELLGLKLLYLDAGSGAERAIAPRMISTIRTSVELPLMVGGGITTPAIAQASLEAGADVLVIGNVLEKDPGLLTGIAERVYEWNAGTGIRN